MNSNYHIRKGESSDMTAVFKLVKDLAIYEKAPHEVVTSPDEFIKDGFGENPIFDTFVAENDQGELIGFALYFTAYSTWKGKSLYLEDFFVSTEHRGKGVAQQLFEKVLEVAKERKVKRFHWQVLDWNEPAIKFYKKYEAEFESDWLNVKIRLES